MSQNNFHSLYVAPLIVGLITAVVGGLVAALWDPGRSPPAPAQAAPPGQAPRQGPERPALTADLKFPTDAATQQLLRDYLADAASADRKYRGTRARVVSVVALVGRDGEVELYGATHPNQVEGIYFRCRLANPAGAAGLCRNQLVTLDGTVGQYVHHQKSPYIIVEGCTPGR